MLTCVSDLAWGDGGKGKIVDILAPQHQIVVRYNGGSNAGHSVVVDGNSYAMHLLPCGFLHNTECVLASGMVIDPVLLAKEIKEFNPDKVLISDKAHVVMPWHVQADAKKGGKIGTTMRGIGPCYADKMHRWNAIRMGSLLSKLEDEKLSRFFAADDRLHGVGLWEKYHGAAEFLSPFICDTGKYLREQVKQGTKIVFESANGIQLDVDYGTYPYVTSSAVGPAAIPQSCGLPNLKIDRIIGVVKSYMTRVGNGPFPSEIESKPLADEMRKIGNEFGTTTGRPRRIGWLDLDVLAESVELTGATEIALMHADVLTHFNPYIKKNGSLISMQGWTMDDIKNVNDLGEDSGLIDYIKIIEGCVGCPISLISYGPDRSECVVLDKKKG